MNPFALNSTSEAALLTLTSELTIEHARGLHEALAAALVPARPLVIDASALTRLDAAALQVLLAAARNATIGRLAAASPAWSGAFARHGLADPFDKS